MRLFLFTLLSLLFLNGCSKCPFKKGHWVDLSHDFSESTIYWPTGEPFKLVTEFEGVTKNGYYYSAYKYSASEHGGTHIDAPIHFAKGGKTVDQISIDRLTGSTIVIDISRKALENKDYQITQEDISNWESNHGRIPDNSVVFLHTGYGKFWPDRIKYLGTNKVGKEGVNELHFPGLQPDTASYLVKNRKIKAIGLDTASIDYGQSKNFECHQIFLGNDIPIFENVANLDKLPPKGTRIIALPMKIKRGSGAPLRIAAWIKD